MCITFKILLTFTKFELIFITFVNFKQLLITFANFEQISILNYKSIYSLYYNFIYSDRKVSTCVNIYVC